MRHVICQGIVVVLISSMCVSCMTAVLWSKTNPKEKVFIPHDQITEAELQRRGVNYSTYTGELGHGYLIDKSTAQKFTDYTLRIFGTPVLVIAELAIIGALLAGATGYPASSG